ncbi:MAG TPA: carboxypeptidase M32, partial [Anaerolineales bacterium]
MATSEQKLQELRARLLEISDLNHINALLSWDQSTYMPPGGAEARGRQSARLAQMAQEKFVDKEIGKLLDDLRPYGESLPYESDDASLIRVTRREYERALKVPPKFIGELNEHGTWSYQTWT